MRITRFVPVFVAAAAVGGLLTGDLASAAAPLVTPAARTAVHLTDYSDNDGSTSTVILADGIGDYGKATSVHPDGTVDPEHSSQLDLALTQGSFRLDIGGLHQKIIDAFADFPANKKTCSGTVNVTGWTPIVAGSGTGAYRGIRGGFTLAVAIDEVDQKPACTGLLNQTIVISGPGSVSTG
ncbi:MAG: hypothetical protein JWQ81_205 [Amycolatopsis sp.]|jgi:hypothetical protein|uniref:hypothetical protein n=1 Tax=Amycolatopsis sp. TaxID=37632 RepID=UPI0026087560|nr:hypothetical protein [Amycolatopsis sp.]MCU1679466.1 hypothetical protein [Amycolatopsis sp.]